MLTITLISVSHKQPKWVVEAFEEYAKRLPARELAFQFKELKPEPRASDSDSAIAASHACRGG
jgi:23S rRNA (pseudouridine1915-N3)-methyltransferase